MSSKAPFWKARLRQWKLAQQKMSCKTGYQMPFYEVNDSSPMTEVNDSSSFTEVNESTPKEVEWEQLEKDGELRQLLSRKVPIPLSKINPYRVVIFFQLVALAFYFRYRLLNPVQNAYGLWLASILCESWFTLSWILNQLPKLQPISRETYPDRLFFRYNHPGNQWQLACIDVFVTTMDPLKEPPLVTSNTVLSVLSVDYPAERITCYVSDDGASLLTHATLLETCQLARKWVPFCRKFNIEPRSPECYFSKMVDYLKNTKFPTFAKERRAMKRKYEEFKVQINCLVAKFQSIPCDGWAMRDGTPWPGNNIEDHPGMIQILLGQTGPRDCEGKELPQLVYVSHEKRPGYQHNKMAGAMNSLFPQRFDGIDKSNECADNSSVFYDINLKGLDGIQGPFYIGTGCFFKRKALYGYDPPSEPRCSRLRWHELWKKKINDVCGYAFLHHLKEDDLILLDIESNSLENENTCLFQSLKKCFGESSRLIASIVVKRDIPHSAYPEGLLKEAIHVISCDYEYGTVWGREMHRRKPLFLTGFLEMRWSGVGPQEWWKNQQLWLIRGVSSDLFAVIYGLIKILRGKKVDLTVLIEKSAKDDFMELCTLRWTSLLILPTTIILINLWAIISGISLALNGDYGFAKMIFSFWVTFHLYPLLKELVACQHRVPTVVVACSLLLAALFSMLWVLVNPFVTRYQGLKARDCGIYC